MEIQYGNHEGTLFPDWQKSGTPFVGESYASQEGRVSDFIEAQLLNDRYQKIVLVTHSGVIKALRKKLMGQKKPEKPANGELQIINFDPSSYLVSSLKGKKSRSRSRR